MTDLMAMLPRPVSVPESSRDDRDAAVAPLLKLFRHLHESVHTLSAENAQLRAALGGRVSTIPTPFSDAVTPRLSDIVPPGERAECDTGPRPGPDDPQRRSTRVIEGKPNPPAARSAPPSRPAWEDWLDAGGYGGPGYDRWADNR